MYRFKIVYKSFCCGISVHFFVVIIECGSYDGCHSDATCNNTDGSYTCECKEGFTGDGFTCDGRL